MYKKSSLNCPAILKTSILKTDPIVTTPHDHLAEPLQVEVTKVIVKIKLKATHSSVNPSQIYAKKYLKLIITLKPECHSRKLLSEL